MKKDIQSIWLIPYIQRRLAENRNLIAIFVGDTGSGKSYASLSLAESLDADFSVNQIVFNVKDFVRLMNNGNLNKGSVLIFDDAGLGINAREWQKMHVKLFGLITQAFRYRQYVTLITVPRLSFIEKQTRSLAHLIFEATSEQGIMKPKIPLPNPYNANGIWMKYPTMQVNKKIIRISRIKFHYPTAKLAQEYEAKKKEYVDNEFKNFEKLLEETDEKGKRKSGVHLVCPNCGHEWIYKGKLLRTKCPSCWTHVKVITNSTEYKVSLS